MSNSSGCSAIGVGLGLLIACGSLIVSVLAWLSPFHPIGPSPLGGRQDPPAVRLTEPPAQTYEPEPAPANPLSIVVHDHLSGQYENEITLTIGSVTKTFRADQATRLSERVFSLPGPGSYDYSIEATSIYAHDDISDHSHNGTGSGSIYIEGGETFDIKTDYDFGHNPFSLRLAKVKPK